MNLAADILKNREAVLEGNEAEAVSYGAKPKSLQKTANTTVPLDEARRRVTIELGEITRRKTEDKNVVELLSGTKVIGKAEAVYKTKTQRTWTVTIGDTTLVGMHTISKGLRAFDEANSVKAKVIAGPTPKANSKKANG